MYEIPRGQFEILVRKLIEELPVVVRDKMKNIDVVLEDWPSPEQLIGTGIDQREQLLGLYEGIPVPERYGYDMVLPDKISLFQKPLQGICSSLDELTSEVQQTIIHEVAHHFGLSDRQIEREEF